MKNKKKDFSWWASQDEREAADEAQRQFEAEMDWDLAQHTLTWTTSSGQRIVVRRGFDDRTCRWVFEVEVNGEGFTAVRGGIVDLPTSPVPGIVARVGNIGLTAERRNTLKKWMEED